MPKQPYAIIIRDGFGFNPETRGNAVAEGNTPNHDSYLSDYPTTLICASGTEVGLPPGNQGSSEVGHLNLGAGRIVYQSLVRINRSIEDGSFFDNTAYLEGVKRAVRAGTSVHVMGLVQDQGVHGHTDHLLAIMKLAKNAGLPPGKCLVHVFTDGRDTLPRSAEQYVKEITDFIEKEQFGVIATVCGRYYAMDRDNRWERVQLAYDLLAKGVSASEPFGNVYDAITDAYAQDESDEFIKPRILGDFKGFADNDTVIHFNYRLDRTRELSRAFVEDGFGEFETVNYEELTYICTTEYYQGITDSDRADVLVAFPKMTIENLFGQFISDLGMNQLRIAETEKYAHVTFFFNGQSDVVFKNEERVLVNSPKVATYDLKPEMSAYEVRDKVLEELSKDVHDVIILNYANCDMVGHTGVFDAAVKAVETVDECVGDVVDRILELDGVVLLTSDHGNAEQMIDYETGKVMTAHTTNDVWLSLISKRDTLQVAEITLRENGVLADVAPTLIEIMGLDKPAEMTGTSLISS